MTTQNEVLLIIGMMLVTFGVRYSMLALSARWNIPSAIERALRFVPVAVLTALCTPILLKPAGSWFISFDNSHLLAGVAAIAIAALSRNLLLTIVLGMGLFLWLHLGR